MRKDKTKANLYFVQLNLNKTKHEGLIEWIKAQSDNKEQSMSAFCISILKSYYEESVEDGAGTTEANKKGVNL
jgi:hypothetical protein